MSYLQISRLKISYGDKVVLHNIDLSDEKGEMIALLGPSGCGKTTLLKSFRKEYPNSIFIQAYKGMKKTELIALISGGKESSLKKIKAMAMVMTTLSLSNGTTRERSPSCKALK